MASFADRIQTLGTENAFKLGDDIARCEQAGRAAIENQENEKKQRTSPSTLFQMFALYHHGVAIMDRRSFGAIGSEGKHYLILSTATDMESLKEGIRRIEMASKDNEGFRKFINTGERFC